MFSVLAAASETAVPFSGISASLVSVAVWVSVAPQPRVQVAVSVPSAVVVASLL